MRLIVATLTPFDRTAQVDHGQVREHLAFLAEGGVDGFAPTGTSGEFLYLSWAERRALHATTLENAHGREVVPCVWDPSPGRAAELARAAEADGAAAVFLPPPLYHVVGDEAVRRWYGAVRDAVALPVWAYDHPRTHNPISVALWRQLVADGVEAMKDSSGDPVRVSALADACPGRVYAGGDHLQGRAVELGPCLGHISRQANLTPALCRRAVDGDAAAREALMVELARGGGLVASKQRLGFGCRAPIA